MSDKQAPDWTGPKWSGDRAGTTKSLALVGAGKTISPSQFATTEMVALSPLPCLEHLSPEQRRARVEAIVQRIEETAAKGRGESGSTVLGVAAVCTQKPFDSRSGRRSPPGLSSMRSPAASAVSPTRAYHLFLVAFRDAADRLRAGDRARGPG